MGLIAWHDDLASVHESLLPSTRPHHRRAHDGTTLFAMPQCGEATRCCRYTSRTCSLEREIDIADRLVLGYVGEEAHTSQEQRKVAKRFAALG